MKNRALGVCRGGVEGRRRSYNVVSEEKISKMMELNFQQRTEAKIKWAVRCYNEWREMRLEEPNCDLRILESDINNLRAVSQDDFEFSLIRFICEVKKTRCEGDYPWNTLYQLVCALQNHLRKQEIAWKLVHGDQFQKFNRELDMVMQERAVMALGTVRKQAQVISLDYENQLWMKGVLGEDHPDKLRNTVLYLLGVNLALRAGDEHYALRRPGECVGSQLSFELNDLGVKCLVYREDNITKTNRGGLKDMKKERKIVWVKPNTTYVRCPVRIIEKYLNLLPKDGKKPNLYLQSLKKPRPYCWYSSTPIGINKLRSVVSSMLRDAGLNGFFTNHSLRRTCATRLFQAGQDVKLVKEITGHVSDAVTKYQTTSDMQRMSVSSIIQGDVQPFKLSQAEGMQVVQEDKPISNQEKFMLPKFELPVMSKKHEEAEGDSIIQVSNVIESAVQAVGNRKAKITVQVEMLE